MGEVYRARLEGELGFSRQVVLKRLAVEHVEDESLLASFVREAEVAARIAHPNVVQIFDLQRHGAEPFIIMEYLEGLSLQKLASRAWRAGMGLDADVLTRCALDAARGLHAAHTMRGDDGTLVGLVHRDVSPDNLFLCTSGFTKLLDFGIARRSDLKTMTGKNELKGKIPYMSPEQILGEPLDARSDLFSLGSSLYYLLTGKRPFVGDNDVTTLYAVVNKAHRPLNEVRPDAAGLVEVVEALLQKQPDDRPASALEVVERLARAEAASAEEAAAFLRQIEEL
jgi:serine/threonine-protein kinase